LTRFNACSARAGSTFSPSFSLPTPYENISCDFYHRAGDGRVPEFLRAEEGRANGHFVCYHDSRCVDDQEELDQEDIDRFGRSLAGCEEEDDCEKGGSVSFSFRIGFTFADSLI